MVVNVLDLNKGVKISQYLAKAFELLTQLPKSLCEEDRQDCPPQERNFYV